MLVPMNYHCHECHYFYLMMHLKETAKCAHYFLLVPISAR